MLFDLRYNVGAQTMVLICYAFVFLDKFMTRSITHWYDALFFITFSSLSQCEFSTTMFISKIHVVFTHTYISTSPMARILQYMRLFLHGTFFCQSSPSSTLFFNLLGLVYFTICMLYPFTHRTHLGKKKLGEILNKVSNLSEYILVLSSIATHSDHQSW